MPTFEYGMDLSKCSEGFDCHDFFMHAVCNTLMEGYIRYFT